MGGRARAPRRCSTKSRGGGRRRAREGKQGRWCRYGKDGLGFNNGGLGERRTGGVPGSFVIFVYALVLGFVGSSVLRFSPRLGAGCKFLFVGGWV